MEQTTIRGAVAASMVCTWALQNGHVVSFPACDVQPPYDLILDRNGTLQKVQVKRTYSRTRHGGHEVRVKIKSRHTGRYDLDMVDIMALVDVDTKRIWMIPMRMLHGRTDLGLTNGKYDQWLVT